MLDGAFLMKAPASYCIPAINIAEYSVNRRHSQFHHKMAGHTGCAGVKHSCNVRMIQRLMRQRDFISDSL